MSRKTRKRGRRRLLVIVVLLALIVFGVFARGLLTSGKTTTERAQRELDTYAEKNDASLDAYPDALVQLYARNPDARDFVRDYPKKKDLTPTIDLSGLAGSETVPLLLQWDERWGYRDYNESIIGLAGCGPTCLSMVTIYLTGDTTKDPLWMCRFAEQHQFNVPGSGSKWALISEGGRMLGLDVTQIPLDQDRIYRNLDVGNPIIVVVGPGDFTTDGHFLVLTGHDGDKITLNDPNSPTNSQKSWDYDTLAGDTTKDPLWMCRFAEQHQFNVPGSGSKWALISEGGRMLGLDVTQIPLDQDRIYRNLDVGNPIIVVVGPGDFTTDGHFLVLTGHDGDKITLNDPNSPTNSQKSWDYDTLAGQIQSLWVLRRAG